MKKQDMREKAIMRGSLAGLLGNFLLFVLKFCIGQHSGSVSVVADAFNNLSDMGASLITMIGFKMAQKPSDEQHPFGHGRIEYISSLIVSFIILLLGLELARDAVGKMIAPAQVAFSGLTFFLLCIPVPVKLLLGFYNRHIGKKVNSPALTAAGKDSLNDVLVTFATILSALLSPRTHLPVDAGIGLGLSVFVIFSGIGILKDTLGPLLGQAPPKELAMEIAERVLESPGVTGIHDMIVHNYGPDRFIASVHAEVRADCDILKIHDSIDLAERKVQDEMNVLLTIHIDPVDTDDALTCKLKTMVQGIVKEIDESLSIHDFRIVSGDTHTNLIFDLVVPAALQMQNRAIAAEIDRRLKKQNPAYFTVITFDRAFL